MLPRSHAFDENDPPTEFQYVFFVRHGQSRWNQAQETHDLVGMYQERDHGLSDNGRQQAEDLRRRIAARRSSLEHGQASTTEAAWLQRFFKPDFVYSSPLTRAIETALIGLTDILIEKGKLIIMKEAREQKNFGGADSSGIAIGDAITARAREELRVLYTSVGEGHTFNSLACSLDKFDIDVSEVQGAWWHDVVERDADVVERLNVFLGKLRSLGDGGVSIVVGHSHMFRRVFQDYVAEVAKRDMPDIAASLRTHTIPLCGIVGFKLEWGTDGKPRVMEMMPIVGTELRSAKDVGTQSARLFNSAKAAGGSSFTGGCSKQSPLGYQREDRY